MPYSILGKWDKRMVIFLCASTGLWSTIATQIYYPILTLMKSKFSINDEMMNLAVVLYLIFQGLSPSVMGNLADLYGRRPLMILSVLSYVAANIGLALTNTYWLILVLRCVQAAGIAPVISISAGIVGDISTRHERAGMMGVVTGLQLVGQGFGALIGAALLSGFNWRAIFWFLAICGGVVLVLIFILLPETKRHIVGNCSVTPPIFNFAPILISNHYQKQILKEQTASLDPIGNTKFDVLLSFKLLIYPEVGSCLISVGLIFGTWMMALTLYSNILSNDYHLSTMVIGVCYLPSGIGALTGAMISGKVMDHIYLIHKRKYDSIQDESKPKFNIIKARCSFYYYPTTMFTISLVIFGWTLDRGVNISVPLVASFSLSLSCMFPMTMLQTVLVDIFPFNSSTSSSLLNITRCWLGALFIGVLSKMISAMTVGGCFTFMACLCLVTNIAIYILIHDGDRWIERRLSS